ESENHAHPVTEIISAIDGTFTLTIEAKAYKNLVFAIIDANMEHKVSTQNTAIEVLMLENNNTRFSKFLGDAQITFSQGFFVASEFVERGVFFDKIKSFAKNHNLKEPEDQRVGECLRIMEKGEITYATLVQELSSKVFLSKSRLSHLFTAHMGVSLKKYLVWNNLKRAIDQYLSDQSNLTEVSLQNGFFDQAHLSRSFKKVLGVRPSSAYNSSTVQF
ncbi:MAG: AraC family transcriptional regulator, partial [Bacteroidota bacterium]